MTTGLTGKSNSMPPAVSAEPNAFGRQLNYLAARVPYEMGAGLLDWAFRWHGLNKTLFRHEAALLSGFLEEFPQSSSFPDLLRRRLTNCILRSWRSCALFRLPLARQRDLVQVEGREYLDQASANGRGVLLLGSHYGASHLAPMTLWQLGYPVTRLGRQEWLVINCGFDPDKHHFPGHIAMTNARGIYLNAFARATRVLQSGGILHMAGDGPRGAAIHRDFLHRKLWMSNGFAALAQSTGVRVLPVYATVEVHGEAHGRVCVEIGTPLMPTGSGTQAIESLALAYRQFLEQRWREDPAPITASNLTNYLGSERNGRGPAPAP